MRGILVLVAALMVAAPASATEAFRADLPFTDVQSARVLPTLSGALELSAAAGGAPTVLSDVSAFAITGLTLVCWESPCLEGDLQVRVVGGSTVALRYPQTGTLRLEAAHALAVPVDLAVVREGFGELSAGLRFAPSLAAATASGTLRFERESLPSTPDGPVPARAPSIAGLPVPAAMAAQFQAPDPTDANAVLLASLTPGSRIEVLDSMGVVLQTLPGQVGLLMQGYVEVSPVHARAFVVPCAVQCDLKLRSSAQGADVAGALRSLLGLVGELQQRPPPAFDLGPFASVVDPVASGAFIELPVDARDFRVANLTLARFDTLQATLSPSSTQATGSGELVIRSGDVQGAPAFAGGRYFAMPVWSYALWAAGLVALGLRLLLDRDGRPDGSRLPARLVGLAAFAALAAVWHFAFVRALGLGVATHGLDGRARLAVGAVELGTLLVVVAMVAFPARLLLASTLRLAGREKLAWYAPAAGRVAAILVGVPLLLGFVDFTLGWFA